MNNGTEGSITQRLVVARPVRTAAIPRQATTSAARKKLEHGRGFRKLVKWRTGSEGRISYLKRGYG
jgi:transposase, IS5 family